MTHWLLNSAVIAASAYGEYRYSPATRMELRAFLARGVTAHERCPLCHQGLRASCEAEIKIVSRVGYSETADMIERWTDIRVPLSRDMSALEPGDVAMVVRLRYRVDPDRKGAPAATGEDAWEIGRLERLS